MPRAPWFGFSRDATGSPPVRGKAAGRQFGVKKKPQRATALVRLQYGTSHGQNNKRLRADGSRARSQRAARPGWRLPGLPPRSARTMTGRRCVLSRRRSRPTFASPRPRQLNVLNPVGTQRGRAMVRALSPRSTRGRRRIGTRRVVGRRTSPRAISGTVVRPRGRGRRRISERRRDVVSLPLGEDRRTPPITARTATTRTDCCTAPGASPSARAWATRRCRRLTRPARLSSPSTMSSARGFSPRVPQIRRDARVRRRRERLPRRRERHSSRRITRFRLRRRGNWRRRRRHRRERAIPNG